MSKSVKEGGLGLKSLSNIMHCFRINSAWNILRKDSIYASFMRYRYITDLNIRDLPLISTTKNLERYRAMFKGDN